jgi:hypothetical protein
MAIEQIHTYCAMCVSRCGVVATVNDGRFEKASVDPEHPNGCICIKGSAAPEIRPHALRFRPIGASSKASSPSPHPFRVRQLEARKNNGLAGNDAWVLVSLIQKPFEEIRVPGPVDGRKEGDVIAGSHADSLWMPNEKYTAVRFAGELRCYVGAHRHKLTDVPTTLDQGRAFGRGLIPRSTTPEHPVERPPMHHFRNRWTGAGTSEMATQFYFERRAA